MSQPNINCNVCGGTEFTLDSGFYFCLECNTQSQDVREVVFDEYFGNQKATTRALKNTSKTLSSGPNERLTSWEVLNYTLKGVTDELLALGAKPELKIITLQLWASYLRKLDVAFTSVEIERKPKLGYAFKRSDAEIIYGVTDKQLKGKSWRSRSRSVSGSSFVTTESEGDTSASGETRRSMLRKLNIRKKALASAEYSQMSQGPVLSSQTLEGLNISSEVAGTPQRLKITKHAKKILSSSYTSSTSDISERRKLLRKETMSIRNLTIAKIAALSTLALALTNQDIQVSDFIRWVDEGHISLGNPQKFIPEGIKLEPQMQRMLELGHLSYTSCHELMARFRSELEIQQIPPPHLNRLAERYCLELQLPGDLENVVKKIQHLISNKHDQHTFSERCCETQAMAAIVVAVKLLFSLDDCTEYHLSQTATKLNRVLGDQLFVFSDWVKFIECRKAVVSTYHLPTRNAVYGNTMGRDPQMFIQHYAHVMEQQQLNNRDVSKRYALNKTWVEAMVRCLNRLASHQPQGDVQKPITFPPSLTPLHTYCQTLLTHHPEQVAAASSILCQNFLSHSLEFIICPERIIALGLADDIFIFQRPEGAAAMFQVKKFVPKDKFVIPKFKINQTNISVGIVKNSSIDPENNIEKENVIESFENSLYRQAEDIIADDSEEEEDKDQDGSKLMNNSDPMCHTLLQLFNTASQYWCIHINLSKNEINNDDFEVFAMKNFPSSFLWLLRECSRTINVSPKDLYTSVVCIEKKINNKINIVNRCTKRKR